jgi:hypothetical protein
VDIEENMQIMGIRRWRTQCKERTERRESLRRLKPTVGCNASKRRRRRILMSYFINFNILF